MFLSLLIPGGHCNYKNLAKYSKHEAQSLMANEVLARLPVLSPGYFSGHISETQALLAAEGDMPSLRLTHSQESGERLGTGPWRHKFP